MLSLARSHLEPSLMYERKVSVLSERLQTRLMDPEFKDLSETHILYHWLCETSCTRWLTMVSIYEHLHVLIITTSSLHSTPLACCLSQLTFLIERHSTVDDLLEPLVPSLQYTMPRESQHSPGGRCASRSTKPSSSTRWAGLKSGVGVERWRMSRGLVAVRQAWDCSVRWQDACTKEF